MDIKPIETRYRGYRFRSRLEARWGIFFETMGIQWDYEREGFELPSGRYLPDFWLPQVDMWAEVKPDEFTPEEKQKCWELVNATRHSCLMLVGPPDYRSYLVLSLNDICIDCIIDCQYLDERRFYSNTGMECNDPDLISELQRNPHYKTSIETARSARFEFGESGAA